MTEKIDPSRYVYVPGVTKVSNIDLDKVVVRNRATGKRVTETELEAEGRELDRQRGAHVDQGTGLRFPTDSPRCNGVNR